MKSQINKIVIIIIFAAIIVGVAVYFSKDKITDELSEQVAEYRSPAGIKFQYPVFTGRSNNEHFPDLAGEFTVVQEPKVGGIIIRPNKEPDFIHTISVYEKESNMPIKDAIAKVYRSLYYPETKCTLNVEEYSSLTATGQIRFSVGATPLSSPDLSQYDGSCITVAQFIQYNPKRPDRFLIFTIGHDSFLDLSIIENSLEIEN